MNTNTVSESDILFRIDPRTKLFLILAVSLAAIIADSFFTLTGICCISFLLVLASPLRNGSGLKFMAMLSFFIVWGTVLGQGFFYQELPRRPLMTVLPEIQIGKLTFEGLTLYLDGLLYGFKQSLRLLASAWAGAALCRSTSAPQIISVMRWLRLPHSISFMVVTALRFFPRLLEEIRLVRQARRIKGYRIWRGNIIVNMVGEFKIMRPIFANLVRRSHTLGLALAARGFHPGIPRDRAPLKPLATGDRIILISGFLFVSIMAGGRILFLLYVNGLYYAPSLRPLYAFVRNWF